METIEVNSREDAKLKLGDAGAKAWDDGWKEFDFLDVHYILIQECPKQLSTSDLVEIFNEQKNFSTMNGVCCVAIDYNKREMARLNWMAQNDVKRLKAELGPIICKALQQTMMEVVQAKPFVLKAD